MAYNIQLADRVRQYLQQKPGIEIEEKAMFSGLAFIVNGKMCVNVSGDRLMCRYDPEMDATLAEEPGYQPMIMKGKELAGYCYVSPEVLQTAKALAYWIGLCLSTIQKQKLRRKEIRRLQSVI
ncbi:TfoX/Sxy family protein [Niabella hibiscisoli]|uniref:TfoX/Sxy family protein n=1 Tax=Niabella hibiscisoli TaxID=1825928 RepID=UPI001F0E46A4|nr:TfoX/Sxy family protein [Niabella hibiscisoli]MCH5719812.1 TfoX/Sxy family protein [Niabella hibiscisoli]